MQRAKRKLLYIIFLIFSVNIVSAQLKMTWNVDAGMEIELPGFATSAAYTIDWGDGTINAATSHTYTNANQYQITVLSAGELYFSLKNFGHNDRLLSIDEWGGVVLSSGESMFMNCENLKMAASDSPIFKLGSKVVSMFENCSSLTLQGTGKMDHWDFQGVTDMSAMLKGCQSFNSPINWTSTSSCTTFDGLFAGCSSFDQALNTLDVSGATSLRSMFEGAIVFNQVLDNWDVSQVTDFDSFLSGASTFNRSLNSWNTQSAINMSSMFRDCEAFNRDISAWDVQNVTKMTAMFKGCKFYNRDISSWNTGRVQTMEFMFDGAERFDHPLGNWDVRNTLDMSDMFRGARRFNQPLKDWNTLNVTRMSGMFNGASNFNQDISTWKTDKVTEMDYMFHLASSFNQPIGDWDVRKVITMSRMFFGASVFNQPLGSWDVRSVTDFSYMFHEASVFNQPLNSWTTTAATRTNGMFSNAKAFNQPLDAWNVSNVTEMGYMFDGAIVFDQSLNNWNVSKVVNIENMFRKASRFNQDLDQWDVRNITKVAGTFSETDNFNGDISNWNTANVEQMQYLFYKSKAFNGDIRNWNVGKVSNFDYTFAETAVFNQNLRDWDTKNAISMSRMFHKASVFNQDSLIWNTSNLLNATEMFLECATCNPVVETWDISNLEYVKAMFRLSGLSANNYDKLLISWGNQKLTTIADGAFESPTTFCTGEQARQVLESKWGTITDQGKNCSTILAFDAPTTLQDNLVAWYRADSGLTMSGTGVIGWEDQSSYQADLTSRRPALMEYEPLGLNFNPVLQNQPVDIRSLSSNTILPVRTMFIVNRPTGTRLEGIVSKKNKDKGNVRLDNSSRWFINGNYGDFTLGNSNSRSWVNGLTTNTFDSSHILIIEASEMMVYETGLDVSTSRITSRSWKGDIAEIIFYADSLSDAERQRIESYLALKYGMTLDQTTPRDYVAFDNTVIWDASAAGTFSNEIFGIGRSDASNFHQRISASTLASDELTVSSSMDFSTSNVDKVREGLIHDESYFIVSNNGMPYELNASLTDIPSSFDFRLNKVYRVSKTNFDQPIHLHFEGLGHGFFLLKNGTPSMSNATAVGPIDEDGFITVTNFSDGDYFTLAKRRFAPSGIKDNLGLWLRPEFGTNTTVAGDDVTTWKDQSTGTLTASGASYPQHPVFSQDSLNFNPAIYFKDFGRSGNQGFNFGDHYFLTEASRGGMHFITVALPRIDKEPRFIFNVGLHTGGNIGLMFSTDELGSSTYDIHSVKENSTEISIVELDLDFDASQSIIKNGKTLHSSNLAWDEVNSSNVLVAENHRTNGGPFSIGRQSKSDRLNWNGGRYFRGHLGDFIIYQGDKDDLDLAKIRSYLAVKYGVTLDQTSPTDYINPDGETIWDSSRAGVYKHNIFGIGRQKEFLLDQRISRSQDQSDGLIVTTGNDYKSSNQSSSRPALMDGTYFFVANNNQANEWVSMPSHALVREVLAKTWKATNQDDIRTYFQYDLSKTGFQSLKENEYIGILIDENHNGDFADETFIPLEVTGIYASGNVKIPDGAIFTFAKAVLDTSKIIPFERLVLVRP